MGSFSKREAVDMPLHMSLCFLDTGCCSVLQMAVGDELKGQNGVFWANSKPGKHTFEAVEVSLVSKSL